MFLGAGSTAEVNGEGDVAGEGEGAGSGAETAVLRGLVENALNESRRPDGQQQVRLGLAGRPECIKFRVLQLDHTLLGLQESGQVGLSLLKEVFQVGRDACQARGKSPGLIDQANGPVPPDGARAHLGNNPLLRLLQGLVGAAMLGLALALQRATIVPDWNGRDEDEPDVLQAGFIGLVLGADDRAGDAIGPGQVLGGLGSGHYRSSRMNVRAVLQGDLDEILFGDWRNAGWQDEFIDGLGRPGRVRNPDLVPQVGQGDDVVLLSSLGELP